MIDKALEQIYYVDPRSNWNSNFMQNAYATYDIHYEFFCVLPKSHHIAWFVWIVVYFFCLLVFSFIILLVHGSLERFFQIHLNVCVWNEWNS